MSIEAIPFYKEMLVDSKNIHLIFINEFHFFLFALIFSVHTSNDREPRQNLGTPSRGEREACPWGTSFPDKVEA